MNFTDKLFKCVENLKGPRELIQTPLFSALPVPSKVTMGLTKQIVPARFNSLPFQPAILSLTLLITSENETLLTLSLDKGKSRYFPRSIVNLMKEILAKFFLCLLKIF